MAQTPISELVDTIKLVRTMKETLDSLIEVVKQLAGRLLTKPHPLPRYTLDELLAQTDPAPDRDAEEQAWINAPAVGRELM